MTGDTTNITGYYYLQGVRETAAGIHFKPNSTFEFFYSYGASDRYANGTYSISNGKLIIKGDKLPGNDLKVINSSRKGTGFSLKVVHKNPVLTSDIICIRGEGDVQHTDRQGRVVAPEKPDSIQLIHPFFPDEPTVIRFAEFPKEHNYFELELQPQLEQVCFLDVAIEIKDGKFSVQLPWLFGERVVTFYREENQ